MKFITRGEGWAVRAGFARGPGLGHVLGNGAEL